MNQCENTWESFFCKYSFLQIFKKAYLRIRKIPVAIFLIISFFNYLKKHTYKSENTWESIFARPLFEVFKKSYLRISKIPGTIFLLIPSFRYLKIILKNLNIPWTIFLLMPFFNYLKKHT